MIDFNIILFHTYSSFLRNVPFTALLALQFKQLLTCLQSNPFWLDLRVFVSPDRTLEERICRQKLVNESKQKRSADPNKHYIIRKGEVVFLSERTGCVDNVWLFFFTAHNSLCIEFFTVHSSYICFTFIKGPYFASIVRYALIVFWYPVSLYSTANGKVKIE